MFKFDLNTNQPKISHLVRVKRCLIWLNLVICTINYSLYIRNLLNKYIINDLASIVINYIEDEVKKVICKKHKKNIRTCCLKTYRTDSAKYFYKDHIFYYQGNTKSKDINALTGIPLFSLTDDQKKIIHITDSYIKKITSNTYRYLIVLPIIVEICYNSSSDDSDDLYVDMVQYGSSSDDDVVYGL